MIGIGGVLMQAAPLRIRAVPLDPRDVGRSVALGGLGIFGQYCWVNRDTRTVIARFSTYPTALPTDLGAETMRGFTAVAEHLAARS